MARSTAIVWLRRDLRVHDNPSLARAASACERVVPAFVLDPAILGGRFASGPRTAFLLGCLRALDDELRERGSGLVVRLGAPEQELPALARETGAREVRWARDATPYAIARDARVAAALANAGAEPVPGPGTFVVDDLTEVRTRAGGPFAVFSPFQRAWSALERRPLERAPRALAPLPSRLRRGSIPSLAVLARELGGGRLRDRLAGEPAVAPGELTARRALSRWVASGLDGYAGRRDELAGAGASRLSAHLRFGALSPREVERRARDRGGAGADAFVRQLAWRDFLAHVMLHHPGDARSEHQPRMRTLAWVDDPRALAAWQDGRTGFPLVDAAMRQLRASGWMPNRARLVAGSFLTKDLGIDWRAGEAWFMRWLLDGDVAQNNGNWQWIASVGVDPAPVARRILNPALQARRHDPDGVYVRRWLGADRRHDPPPIVDHALARRAALERYATLRADSSRL